VLLFSNPSRKQPGTASQTAKAIVTSGHPTIPPVATIPRLTDPPSDEEDFGKYSYTPMVPLKEEVFDPDEVIVVVVVAVVVVVVVVVVVMMMVMAVAV